MNKMSKFIDVEVKAVAGEERTYWFTASTEARDRQGDVIVQSGWKLDNYRKNPVILWGHDYSSTPIGRALEIEADGGKLRMKVQFVPAEIDPFAAKVEKLVASKFLQTMSVGFMVYKQEDLTTEDKKMRPELSYGKRLYGELLESSIVPVPANQEALSQLEFGDVMVRSFGGNKHERPAEKESPLLPYRNEDGTVSDRKLRACFAAYAGARGGVSIDEKDRPACLNHLKRIAKENSSSIPEGMTDQDSLRKEFSDVWHEELLDVIQLSLNEKDREVLPLIKGGTRSALVAAQLAIGKILEATESEPIKETPIDNSSQLIKSITQNLSAVTARLK